MSKFKVGDKVRRKINHLWPHSHNDWYEVLEVTETSVGHNMRLAGTGVAMWDMDYFDLVEDQQPDPSVEKITPMIRTFETGATRNLDINKNDYDGFLSPLVIEEFGDYMHSHRRQKDGTMRDSDNWQKGISQEVYRKSMWRHFFDVWKISRGYKAYSPEDQHEISLKEALCALMFNVQGMLHEHLKETKCKDIA